MKKGEINKTLYYTSPNRSMRFLNDRYLSRQKDIMLLASTIFNIETIFRMGERLDKVKIPISSETSSACDLNKIKNHLQDLLSFVLYYDIEIEFDILHNVNKFKRDKELEFEEIPNICLFSGGIDSYSGILKTKEEFPELLGVFIAHGDQAKGVSIVNGLKDKILSSKEIPIKTLYAPPMKRYGYSQLRGFLYCMYGAIYVSLHNAKNLLITECGPTMYQTRFSPFDSVTMTTHPFVLGKTKSIIDELLQRKINFITPYENLTKAEVFRVSPVDNFFKNTHSCISLGTGENCGHCYGCIVRRLGGIVAGKIDSKYNSNPLEIDFKKADNLISLLRFSYDILMDYEHMNFTSKENIYIYKKQRLFKRFALDNFTALYILTNKGKTIHPAAERFFADVLKKFGKDKFKERTKDVRSGRFIPNFNRKVA